MIMIHAHLVRLLLLAPCLVLLSWLGVPSLVHSATPEEIGLKIATDASANDDGFGNFTASQVMVLRNKQGQESRRRIRVKVLEVDGDGDKSLLVFDEPRDVKGTALLTHGHKQEADDQWLYLPALKRVKRISSSNRSGSFMGSEFSYEDLSTPEVEKSTYRYLRDEPCGDLTCTVSERVPVDKKASGYLRQLVWRDKDELRVWKVAVLRPQGRAPEDAHHRELHAIPGPVLAHRRDDHGQSSDGQEYRVDLGGLSVPYQTQRA